MRFTKTTLSLVALSAAIALHAGVAQAGMTDAGKKAMQAAAAVTLTIPPVRPTGRA